MIENRSKQLLDVVLKAADDKLAQEIVALEVGHLTPVADYFVITHGKNEKQVQAIVDAIEEEVHKEGFEVKSDGAGSSVAISLKIIFLFIFG